jgi:hypothetical protein
MMTVRINHATHFPAVFFANGINFSRSCLQCTLENAVGIGDGQD